MLPNGPVRHQSRYWYNFANGKVRRIGYQAEKLVSSHRVSGYPKLTDTIKIGEC